MASTVGGSIQPASSDDPALHDPDRAVVLETTAPTGPSSLEFDDFEQSQLPDPTPGVAVNALVQSAYNPPMNRWRLAAAGFAFICTGMTDAVVWSSAAHVGRKGNRQY